MDLRRGRSLPQLSLMDNQHWTLSSSVISPLSSGYGTEPRTPMDSTTTASHQQQTQPLFPSTPPSSLNTDQKEDKENHCSCCSLAKPVWSNSSQDQRQLENKPSRSSALTHRQQEVATAGLSGVVSTSRDYSSPVVSRVIVTMDLQKIGPEDGPHHPLYANLDKNVARKPWGTATNSRTEQIYFTDRQHHVVLVFGPDGEYQRKFGGFGTELGFFHRPTGLAYDATNDRLFVVDKGNHRIQSFCATTGQFLFAFGCRGRRPGQFNFPWGVAVSPDGSSIAVSDPATHRVQLFNSDGIYLRLFNIAGIPSRYDRVVGSSPRGMVFDKTGKFLYFTDFNLHRICRLDFAFRRLEIIVDKQLTRPSGIDLDHDGNLVVCDTRNHLIRIFRPNGQSVGYLRRIGPDTLYLPLDITVMPAGNIAVLDLNGRIRVF